MNRAQRRKAERQQYSLDRAGMKQAAELIRRDIDKHGIFDAKAALENPYYMQQVKARRVAQRERICAMLEREKDEQQKLAM